MPNTTEPERIAGLSAIADGYAAILCDVWGVVHNSLERSQPACDALAAYRGRGGRVVLITNAPRPASAVIRQLDDLGVAKAAYDDVISSGDVTRHALVERRHARVLKVGPDRDEPLYEGLDLDFVDEDRAEIISCTGLFDDVLETPRDYEERLQRWAKRGLPMVCANPDIVVERGDRLVYCAGALAKRYAEIGGKTVVAGKPHAPIYEEAAARLSELSGRRLAKHEMLAIGDGVHTDIAGAYAQAIDALFITGGIHAAEWREGSSPSAGEVADFLRRNHAGARAMMPRLVW